MKARLFVIVALACGAACSTPTEVVVVIDTDVTPLEFGEITFLITRPGNQSVECSFFPSGGVPLPATVGVTPGSSDVSEFDVTAQLWPVGGGRAACGILPSGVAGTGGTDVVDQPLATRAASHVRFVGGELLSLFLPLTRHCLCEQTNCPHALEPACADLVAPTLGAFDPNHPPRLSP